jgi:hypothetical protein
MMGLTSHAVGLFHVETYPGTLTAALGYNHPSACPHNTFILGINANHESRFVHERYHRKVKSIAKAP